MAFTLPDLPFDKAALVPYLSAESFDYHHGKHHATYVKVLNELITDTTFADQSLEQIITATAGRDDRRKIFNNAGQHWNHSLFWQSLSVPETTKPDGATSKLLEQSFGGFDAFAKLFVDAAVGQFGSGWAWLVLSTQGKLVIETTSNADLPLAHDRHAVLTVDVWEHAYYIDKRNNRKGFVEDFVTKLINWDTVSRRIETRGKAL